MQLTAFFGNPNVDELYDASVLSDKRHKHAAADIIAVIIVVIVFCAIYAILRRRPPIIYRAACLYVIVLVAIALLMRELSKPPLGYRYPGFVTVLHYLWTWATCALYFWYNNDLGKLKPSSVGTFWVYCRKMIPIGLSLPVSISLNNRSLLFIGAGLSSVVGTLSPVCTALTSRMVGRKLSHVSWFGVLVAFGGAFLIGAIELGNVNSRTHHGATTLLGLLFAVLALLLRSIRIVLQDTLTSPFAYQESSQETPITGMHLLVVQSPPVVLVALIFMFITEHVGDAISSLNWHITIMILITCGVATALNIIGALLLKELGSTHLQIIGKLNTIVTMAVSVAFFHEHLVPWILLGSAIILVGVGIFEYGEYNFVQGQRK